MPPIQIRTVIFIDSLITKRHSIPKYIKYTYKNEKFSHVSFVCLQIFATELKTSLCKQGSIITVITDLVILRDYEYLNRNLKLHTSFRHQWPCQNAVCLFGKKKNQILYYMHISTDLFITGYPNTALQNHIAHCAMSLSLYRRKPIIIEPCNIFQTGKEDLLEKGIWKTDAGFREQLILLQDQL